MPSRVDFVKKSSLVNILLWIWHNIIMARVPSPSNHNGHFKAKGFACVSTSWLFHWCIKFCFVFRNQACKHAPWLFSYYTRMHYFFFCLYVRQRLPIRSWFSYHMIIFWVNNLITDWVLINQKIKEVKFYPHTTIKRHMTW